MREDDYIFQVIVWFLALAFLIGYGWSLMIGGPKRGYAFIRWYYNNIILGIVRLILSFIGLILDLLKKFVDWLKKTLGGARVKGGGDKKKD